MKKQLIKQNVGADISKDDFKVCFYQLLLLKQTTQKQRVKSSRSFKNTLAGFKAFLEWINKHRDATKIMHITLEATGVYYEQLVHFLHDMNVEKQLNLHISVVLPNKTKAYFKSLNLKSKTDKIDAKALGQMGIERDLKKWEPLSDNLLVVKQLTRERVRLLKQKTALSNQLHALKHSYHPNKNVVKRLRQQIKLFEKHLKEIEEQIKIVVTQDEWLNERIEKICEMKGLGIVTVATIVSETNGFQLFTSRGQLMSYVGYDIVLKDSGSSIKGKPRISKKGNKYIRRALHFPALSVVKYHKEFKQLYDRVFENTRIKMKAYVAVQRKILILIYTLFKKNEAYIPNYKNLKNEKEILISNNQLALQKV